MPIEEDKCFERIQVGDNMSKENGDDKYEIKPLEMPPDIGKPFFAYGIFKQGQLAFSKIEDDVSDVVSDEIPFKMLLRDGIPMIGKRQSRNKTKGHKIYFKKGHEEEAYDIICRTEPKNLYEWGTVDIGGEEFNVMFGVKLQNGVSIHCDEHLNIGIALMVQRTHFSVI